MLYSIYYNTTFEDLIYTRIYNVLYSKCYKPCNIT